MKKLIVAFASALAIAAMSSPSAADPKWKDTSAKKGPWKSGKSIAKGKSKRPSGQCKYSFERGARGYAEAWACTGNGYFKPGPPPWAPAHGYRRKGKADYAFPAGLLGGRCRPDLIDGPTVGGLVGAAAGGYVGSQFGKGRGQLAATALGTVVGFVIGQEVGRRITVIEEICFSRTFEHVPDRETIVWNDPRHGAEYEVMPTRTGESTNGMYCREYRAKATVGGKVTETYGTACRQPDGAWKIVN